MPEMDVRGGRVQSEFYAQGAAGEGARFDFWGGLHEAFAAVPENLAGLVDLIADPLGLGTVEAEQEVAAGTFGAMVARFDGGAGAFAYLLFILLYTPCVAAMGAIVREVGPRWAMFAAGWTTGLAYGVAVGFFQMATFTRHPLSSAVWIAILAAAFLGVLAVLKRAGRQSGAPIVAIAE